MAAQAARRVHTEPEHAARLSASLEERERLSRQVHDGAIQVLTLSHRTVENHVQATFRKLQIGNRVELARYAIEHGLDE